MPRSTAAQRARRLNLSRILLQHCPSLPQAVQQLTKKCSISSRQAYRYLRQARDLKGPVPITPSKIAFTVKLPVTQVRQLRSYAARTQLMLSEIVSRALAAMLDRGRKHA